MTRLNIQDLTVEYKTSHGWIRAVEDVDLELREGEILGVVGESGSGKTTVAKAIQGILDENARISDGRILMDDTDLVGLSEKELNKYRWRSISYITQSAMNALDPVYSVGRQFWEVYRVHTEISKAESRSRTRELLTSVGLDPSYINKFPHELSGGERQRVVIGLALALDPPIVIADEPTTGLDVVVQDEILNLIGEIQESSDTSVILITHDINVVAEVADRVSVMYGGKIMEEGTTREVFNESVHPYTIGLRNAFPTLDKKDEELISIPGVPPDPRVLPEGCRFAPRCPFSTETCLEKPPMVSITEERRARCHYPDRAEEFRTKSKDPETWAQIDTKANRRKRLETHRTRGD
jgi:oligopeptide/dipeptide ABC transporter ATP-binding protein